MFERYFDRGVLMYLRYWSMPCIIIKYFMGSTIQDPSQRHQKLYNNIKHGVAECNFSKMLDKMDLNVV